MAVNPRQLRTLLRDCGGSLRAYRVQLAHLLGLRFNERTQQFWVDEKNRQLACEEFILPDVAEELLGSEFCREWKAGGPNSGPMTSTRAQMFEKAAATSRNTLTEEVEQAAAGYAEFSVGHTLQDGPIKALGTNHRLVTEDAAPVLPDAMAQINLYSATVAGLLEVRIMQGFKAPDFISNDFVTIEPTRSNGGKVIQVMNVSPNVELWQPGKEIANVSVAPLFCWAFENIIPAAKISLDKYAVLFDVSGELMAKAANLGYALGYILEYYRLAHVMGVSSITSSVLHPSVTAEIKNRFVMQDPNGATTPNPSYQTTAVTTNAFLPGAYNFVNQKSGTAFTDWTSLQTAQSLLNLMRDPVNNLPFKTEITHLLVDPAQWQLALYVKHQTQILSVSGTPATGVQGAGSTFPPNVLASPGYGDDKLSELNKWMPYHSNIAHQIWLDAQVSETNAKVRWFAGNPKRAFKWRQLQDILVQSANPTSSDMLSRNIIGLWTGQFAGQMVVENPRHNCLFTE